MATRPRPPAPRTFGRRFSGKAFVAALLLALGVATPGCTCREYVELDRPHKIRIDALGGAENEPEILDRLTDSRPRDRAHLVETLGMVGSPLTEELLALIVAEESDEAVRAAAGVALAAVQQRGETPIDLVALREAYWTRLVEVVGNAARPQPDRVLAVLELAAFGRDAAEPLRDAVIAWLGDPEGEAQSWAVGQVVRTLVEGGRRHGAPQNLEALAGLTGDLQRFRKFVLPEAKALMLREYAERAAEILTARLDDPTYRLGAGFLLGALGDPAAVPVFAPWLDGPDAERRRIALDALGLVKHPRVLQEAARVLGESDDDVWVRPALVALESNWEPAPGGPPSGDAARADADARSGGDAGGDAAPEPAEAAAPGGPSYRLVAAHLTGWSTDMQKTALVLLAKKAQFGRRPLYRRLVVDGDDISIRRQAFDLYARVEPPRVAAVTVPATAEDAWLIAELVEQPLLLPRFLQFINGTPREAAPDWFSTPEFSRALREAFDDARSDDRRTAARMVLNAFELWGAFDDAAWLFARSDWRTPRPVIQPPDGTAFVTRQRQVVDALVTRHRQAFVALARRRPAARVEVALLLAHAHRLPDAEREAVVAHYVRARDADDLAFVVQFLQPLSGPEPTWLARYARLAAFLAHDEDEVAEAAWRALTHTHLIRTAAPGDLAPGDPAPAGDAAPTPAVAWRLQAGLVPVATDSEWRAALLAVLAGAVKATFATGDDDRVQLVRGVLTELSLWRARDLTQVVIDRRDLDEDLVADLLERFARRVPPAQFEESALPVLARAAVHPDWEVRVAAQRRLTAQLVRPLEDGRTVVFAPSEARVALIVRGLADGDRDVRDAARRIFEQLNPGLPWIVGEPSKTAPARGVIEAFEPILRAAAASERWRVRRQAPAAIAAYFAHAAVPATLVSALTALLTDSDDDVAEAAWEAVRQAAGALTPEGRGAAEPMWSAFEVWLRALAGHPEDDARRVAIRCLGALPRAAASRLDVRKSAQALADWALAEDEVEPLVTVLEFVAPEIAVPAVRERLIEALEADSARVVATALGILRDAAAPDLLPALGRVYEDGPEEPHVRQRLAALLGKITDAGAERLLVRLLGDEVLPVRLAAIAALDASGATIGLQALQARQKLGSALAWRERQAIQRALTAIIARRTGALAGDPRALLAELARLFAEATDAATRADFLRQIALVDHADRAPLIVAALTDETEAVRMMALESAIAVLGIGAVEHLDPILDDASDAVRARAILLLGKLPQDQEHPVARAFVRRFLGDDEADIRRAALDALAKNLEAPDFVRDLTRAVADDDATIRRRAVDLAEQSQAAGALAVVLAALADGDRGVRQAAWESLARKAKTAPDDLPRGRLESAIRARLAADEVPEVLQRVLEVAAPLKLASLRPAYARYAGDAGADFAVREAAKDALARLDG